MDQLALQGGSRNCIEGGAIVTDEEILTLADGSFVDRRNNVLPTKTFMGIDDEVLTFARLIAAKQREIDSCPQTNIAKAIRSQK